MKITWNIKKKRGNHRPLLTYLIELEKFEQELAVPSINLRSSIPKISNPTATHCLPGEHERHPAWQPSEFHMICVPYFKDGSRSESIRLPFRESGEYPEIEASFTELRNRYEEVVKNAYAQEPIQDHGRLDISKETKKVIAASLTAKKMLNFCNV